MIEVKGFTNFIPCDFCPEGMLSLGVSTFPVVVACEDEESWASLTVTATCLSCMKPVVFKIANDEDSRGLIVRVPYTLDESGAMTFFQSTQQDNHGR